MSLWVGEVSFAGGAPVRVFVQSSGKKSDPSLLFIIFTGVYGRFLCEAVSVKHPDPAGSEIFAS
jgi:hypothetical protein